MKAKALIILGAPGAGKGTQAREVSKHLGYQHISTGEILRDAIREQTALGVAAKKQMEAGDLVADEIVCGIVEARIDQPDCQPGFILDGFPRTVGQARCLDGLLWARGLGDPRVLNMQVDHEVLIKRLTGRRTCPVCGEIYNIYFHPPKLEGLCDKDVGKLYQRSDDVEETIRHRLVAYERETRPLIDYYGAKNLLSNIDGNRGVAQIVKDMLSAVESS